MQKLTIATIVCCASVMIFADETWSPSVHGEGDTLGAINYLAPELVVEAAKLVKTGKVCRLGVLSGRDSPAHARRKYAITISQSGPSLGVDGAEYLSSRGVVAVGSDTWGLEVTPHEDSNLTFPLHTILLALMYLLVYSLPNEVKGGPPPPIFQA